MSGVPVYYAQCSACAFLFAPALLSWTSDEFRRHIYNDSYVSVDPDYVRLRPEGNIKMLVHLFGQHSHAFTHLDYGGGNGLLSNVLRNLGWHSQSFDPMVDVAVAADRLPQVDLVTAFEVFEHVPDVHKLFRDLRSMATEQTVVLFSTLLSDGQIVPGQRLTWWYASPRNGHISLFSRQSLGILAHRYGFQFGSFSPGLHVLFDQIPAWAGHVLNPQPACA